MDKKIAFVTGANQGLGLSLVRGLCRMLGKRGLVYLPARDDRRGAEACARLRDEGLQPELLLVAVADEQSVSAAADTIRSRHGGVDIVISNAAARIAKDVPAALQVMELINTNNHGTVHVKRAFTPLLRDGARPVVVASS